MASPAQDQPTINFEKLRKALASADNEQELFRKIAEAPFEQKMEAAFLFLGLISFYLADQKTKVVKLAAVSKTEHYDMSVRGYKFDPSSYQLSLINDQSNDIVKAITSRQPQKTTDWESLSRQAADPEQARLNQANSGIAYSATYPLNIPKGGALLFCYFQYQENIGSQQQKFMKDYTKMVSEILNANT